MGPMEDRQDPEPSVTPYRSRLDVVFAKSEPLYNAGDVISGHVELELAHELRVKCLKLHVSGGARVSWDEHRTYTKGTASKVSMKNSETFLQHTITLLKKDCGPRASISNSKAPRMSLCFPLSSDAEESGVQIPAGCHKYPFTFTLPSGLPSSYEGRWGSIQYSVKAVLERPWKTDIERSLPVQVVNVIDFNTEPEALRPVAGRDVAAVSGWCCRSGNLIVDVKLQRKGYVIGDVITFSVEVINDSFMRMRDSKVSLVQHITFNAAGKTKRSTAVLGSVSRGPIPPGQSKMWENETLDVPTAIIPTCQKECRAIQTKYTLSVIVTPSNSWYDEFHIPVTVLIGTVAPSKSTLSRALQFYGDEARARNSTTGRLSVAEAQEPRTRRASSQTDIGPGRLSRPTSDSSPADLTDYKARSDKARMGRQYNLANPPMETVEEPNMDT